MKLAKIKFVLRNGRYAWPGGYPLYFVTSDGAALSFDSVKENWREIVSAHRRNDRICGWHIKGFDVNYEDANLYCDHSGERIESAYAEDETNAA